MKVYISESAFMDLVLSSAEVYKKECLGLLLGYRLEDRFIIEHAFTYQTARRRHKGVSFHRRGHRNIDTILDRFNRLQVLGDFHSHTQFGELKGVPNPSPEDVSEMESGKVYIIMAINDNERTMPWKENRDKTVSGSLGTFYFKISAYYIDPDDRFIKKAKIYCHFPAGFNGTE